MPTQGLLSCSYDLPPIDVTLVEVRPNQQFMPEYETKEDIVSDRTYIKTVRYERRDLSRVDDAMWRTLSDHFTKVPNNRVWTGMRSFHHHSCGVPPRLYTRMAT